MATQTEKNFVRAAVLVCGALLTVLPAAAQTQDAPPPPPMATQDAGKAEHRAGKEMKELKDELNLTPDQDRVVKAALAEEMTKMKALRDDTTTPRREKFKTMKAVRDEADGKINAVLNSDQKAKYAAWEAKRREEMKERRGAGGAGMPAGDAPPPPPPGV